MALEKYDISPVTGFVPSQPPLARLPNGYFDPWEKTMDNLHDLLSTHTLNSEIKELPLLDFTRLQTLQEYQRAFLVLCFLSHGYVWENHEEPSEMLPSQLAIPLIGVSDHLGMNPVICHASVALWNYKLIDPKGPMDLSNMEALATFTGTSDESWFHMVTAFVEIAGAPCLPEILLAIDHVRDGDCAKLKLSLDKIRDGLVQMNLALPRMFEKLDPAVFYWKIRPYLSGWKNSDKLPKGLCYDGEYRAYSGASAAQSCLISALDLALGVKHHPTGEKSSGDRNEFMLSMRQYMPRPHREFLEMLESTARIRKFVLEHESDVGAAYNECVHQLKLFRDKHVQIVSLYIINQVRKGPQATEVKGTAGASVMPFLKQSRDETNETKIPVKEKKTWSDWLLGR